ncbi:MAG: putative amino-acid metabolite efflux pump [Candidatus Heimdallarchaeota archaeon LC_2]|nr:MAG: putative amino-acid metabolite efflux pump [Candidatus Heimdallarchaeota archaeon LC_2]
MTVSRYIYALPIISTTSWGISVVGAKILDNNGISPIELVFGRFAIASIFFLPIILGLARNNEGYIPSRGDILPLIGLSVSAVSINNIIFYSGLSLTDASMASLLVSINPLATMLSAVILLNEKMDRNKFISVLLGIIGVAIVIGFNGDSGNLRGNLLIIFAVTLWGTSFSFSKMSSNNGLSAIAITGWSIIIGTLTLLPFVANQSSYDTYKDGLNNEEVVFWFVFIGIVSSMFAYVIHYKAIEILGPGKVAPSTNIIPVSGVFFAYLLLDEAIKGSPLIGFILILFAVYIVQKQPKSSDILLE